MLGSESPPNDPMSTVQLAFLISMTFHLAAAYTMPADMAELRIHRVKFEVQMSMKPGKSIRRRQQRGHRIGATPHQAIKPDKR